MLALAGACVAEQRLAPATQPSTRALVAAIDVYRAYFSRPLRAASGSRCRFEPSCSRYARGALLARGSVVGSLLSARRLARCGPWTVAGTPDPPPDSQAE